MNKRSWLSIVLCMLMLIQMPWFSSAVLGDEAVSVSILLEPGSVVYEGDILPCVISGEVTSKVWRIEDGVDHALFSGSDVVLFDPEPTPLDAELVNITVEVSNGQSSASDTVEVVLHRLFFGDIQFHGRFSDGFHSMDTLYSNALSDNYLDFVCLTDHAEIINEVDFTPPQEIWMFLRSVFQYSGYRLTDYDEWELIKQKNREWYKPGRFTTLLGFEYSPGPWYPGGYPWSPHGHEDVCHICFYYRDVYDDAPEYSARDGHSFDDIFSLMQTEYEKGHRSVCFPHHPLVQFGIWGAYTCNWSFLANCVENVAARNLLLRGVECYSKWGAAIGGYSDLPISFGYAEKYMVDEPWFWSENGMWEWSKPQRVGERFVLIASSDNHAVDRPGSASMTSRISSGHPNPSGLVAAYAVHNTRGEIWDAINNCSVYGAQVLKIRGNARFDGHLAFGQWINCTSPLRIQVSALSTFSGVDSSGRRMHPHAYSADELEYPIQDIWILKKDHSRGQPWCKVVHHETPDSDLAIVEFEDPDVQPYDFYYVAIRQKGQNLEPPDGGPSNGATDEYMAYLGPVFIQNVVQEQYETE